MSKINTKGNAGHNDSWCAMPDARLAVNRLAPRALGSRLAGRGELGEHARARRSFAHKIHAGAWLGPEREPLSTRAPAII